MDDYTPVLIGGGQYTQREYSVENAASPMGVAAEASKQAILDTGAGEELVRHIDTIVSIRIFQIRLTVLDFRFLSGEQRILRERWRVESVQIQLRLSMAMWVVILPKNTSMRWQREYPKKMLN